MSQALDKMGVDANRIVPIFITIDPERDTPKVLKSYMDAFGPSFVGLTGSDKKSRRWKKNIASMPRSSRWTDKGGYGMDHSSVIYLMGPDGRLVTFYDELISPDALAKDLKAKI